MASFLSPLLREKERAFLLRDLDADAVLARHLEPAFDSSTRRRGLLGRTSFDEGSALLIAPCSAIHTFFMRMAIDVVFVSRSGQVLKTYSSLPASRIGFAVRGFAAIELPAGTVARSRTSRGHQLAITPD